MSEAICPQGHLSDTADYCDQCGARIGGDPAAAGAPPDPDGPPAGLQGGPAPAAATSAAPAATKPCPVCNTANAADDRYCESCGYDFTMRPPVAPSLPAPDFAGATPSAAEAAAAAAPPAAAAWEAVVVADQAYYDRMQAEDIAFPVVCPDRRFSLAADRIVIGRRSVSRGINPEIDLSGAPEDVGVSHLHAVLVGNAEGGWSIIDPGSANGTFLNDSTDPIQTNLAVPLSDGDRIHMGAWTTLTLKKL